MVVFSNISKLPLTDRLFYRYCVLLFIFDTDL